MYPIDGVDVCFWYASLPEHMSNQTVQKKPRLLILDCSHRLSLIPISIASLWLTITNHENNIDYATSDLPISWVSSDGLLASDIRKCSNGNIVFGIQRKQTCP